MHGKKRIMPARTTRVSAAGLGVLVLALASACSSTNSRSTSTTTSSPSSPASPSLPAAAAAMIGNDCGMLPASGMGSMHGMAMDPLVTAATHNPLLTMYAALVKQAGLAGELDSMHEFTVFAPENKALAHAPAASMAMLHNAADAAHIVKYGVVTGRITPADLAAGRTFTTLAGQKLTTSKMGAVYEVNTAHVTCGNIPTANATIYIVDRLLIPSAS